ncbi:MAG: hypothetical protein ACLGQX_06640 [Acidobacteriota bacterium]
MSLDAFPAARRRSTTRCACALLLSILSLEAALCAGPGAATGEQIP